MADFQSLTDGQKVYDEAQIVLKDLKDEGALSTRAFRNGDHWQAEAAWIGPQPERTASNRSTVMAEIKRGLVSQNAVKEVTGRHNSAVIGREPSWAFTVRRPLKADEKPTEDEQRLIDEAEAALTEVWDERKILKLLGEAAGYLSEGRAVLRLFVPDGEAVANVSDLGAALRRIYLMVPEPEQACVFTDRQRMRDVGLYSYTVEEEKPRLEVVFADDSGRTIVRIVDDEGNTISDGGRQQEAASDFGGRLTLYEMSADPLITEQVRQHQCLLNMARTMMGRNVVLGGFLERVILNGQMPGEWKIDAEGKKTFEPNPFYVGAGTTNFIAGAVTYDEQGNERLASPSVVYRDPVDVTTFEDTAAAAYRGILAETHQTHALIAGDATASGESRKQAMHDFLKSLEPTKGELDGAGRWLLETWLAMASEFAGQAGRFRELRAVFDCSVDVGEPSSEYITTGLSLVEKKVWSRARLMSATGVDDTEAEVAAIAAEEDTLNPMEPIRRERAQLGLETDRRASQPDAAVRDRIDRGAQGEVVN